MAGLMQSELHIATNLNSHMHGWFNAMKSASHNKLKFTHATEMTPLTRCKKMPLTFIDALISNI